MAVRTRPTFDEPAISYCCPAIATPPVYLELVARMNVWGRPCRGAARDCHDQAKWPHRTGISLSLGSEVRELASRHGRWRCDRFGDALAAVNYPTAVAWLEDHFGITALDEGALDGSRGSWQGRAMNTGQASGYPSGEGLSVANREPHPLRLPTARPGPVEARAPVLGGAALPSGCLAGATNRLGQALCGPTRQRGVLAARESRSAGGGGASRDQRRVWRGDGPRLAKGPRLLLDWCGRCEGDRTL